MGTITYEQIFVEYNGSRYRLCDIVWAQKGAEDGKPVVRFRMRGAPTNIYTIDWDDGGEMLWEMLDDVTIVLHQGG